MLALRFYQRILFMAFVIRAAAVRQKTTYYQQPLLPEQLQPPAQLENDDDDVAAEGLNFSAGNGNSLPKTEIIWEMTRPGESDEQGRYYFARNCLFPSQKRLWRLSQQSNDKIQQKLLFEQMWAKLYPLSNEKLSRNENVLPGPLKELFQKRAPSQWEHNQRSETEPRYPFAFVIQKEPDSEPIITRNHPQNLKREQPKPSLPKYLPSISAGAMTNLGDFFNDLSANVLFTEQSHLGHAESQLLEGNHPMRTLKDEIGNEQDYSEKKAKLLQAIRTYRPSQKVRSLVSRNPEGYRGSQLIDPSYMWVGLGK